ncbi:MAG: cell division protein FtsQ, partial [Prochlorococcus sp.]
RLLISRVLEQRDQLGSPLLKIIVAPDGELSLQTKALGLIQLGMNPDHLDEQLKTITHLTSTIPPEYRNRQGTSIDLSDPGKPELQVPQPSKRPAKTK